MLCTTLIKSHLLLISQQAHENLLRLCWLPKPLTALSIIGNDMTPFHFFSNPTTLGKTEPIVLLLIPVAKASPLKVIPSQPSSCPMLYLSTPTWVRWFAYCMLLTYIFGCKRTKAFERSLIFQSLLLGFPQISPDSMLELLPSKYLTFPFSYTLLLTTDGYICEESVTPSKSVKLVTRGENQIQGRFDPPALF